MIIEYIVMELLERGKIDQYYSLRDKYKTLEAAETAIAEFLLQDNRSLGDGPNLFVLKTFRHDE